jgi:hypothetical protein
MNSRPITAAEWDAAVAQAIPCDKLYLDVEPILIVTTGRDLCTVLKKIGAVIGKAGDPFQHIVFRYTGAQVLRLYGIRPRSQGGLGICVRLPGAVVRRARDEPHVFTVPLWRLAQIAKTNRKRRIVITEFGGNVSVLAGKGRSSFRSLGDYSFEREWLTEARKIVAGE